MMKMFLAALACLGIAGCGGPNIQPNEICVDGVTYLQSYRGDLMVAFDQKGNVRQCVGGMNG